MRIAQLIYHDEPTGWWAASPDLPGYSAVGATYDEVRDLVREGAPWFAEQDLELHHLVLPERRITVSASVGARGSFAVELPSRRRPAFAIQSSGTMHV